MNRLVKTSLFLALLGVSTTVPVLLEERPATFVLFSFVAQPLLAASFLLYLISVLRELKEKGLFG